jgi:hypothetical protein
MNLSDIGLAPGLSKTDEPAYKQALDLENLNYTPEKTSLSDDELNAIVTKASQETGVSSSLIKSVIDRESSRNPRAVGHLADGSVAPHGGKGLMQLVDGTAKMYGVTDSFDPVQNVMGGARYLKDLLKQHGGDETEALRHYRGADETEDPTYFKDIKAGQQEYHNEFVSKLNTVALAPGLTKQPETPQGLPQVPAMAKQGGVIEPPNINLSNRPIVKNPDGSISTVLSKSFNIDGNEVLLPTISDAGKKLTDQEAIALYRKTGKHLGVYNDVASANSAAQATHEQQAKQYAEPLREFKVTDLGTTPIKTGILSNLPTAEAAAQGTPAQSAGWQKPTMVQQPPKIEQPHKDAGLADALEPLKKAVGWVAENVNKGVEAAYGAITLPGDIFRTLPETLGAQAGLGDRLNTPEGQAYMQSLHVPTQDNPLVKQAADYFNNTKSGKWITDNQETVMDAVFAALIAKDFGSAAYTAMKLFKAGRPIGQMMANLPKDVFEIVKTEIDNVKKMPKDVADGIRNLPQDARNFLYTDGWRTANDAEKQQLKDWLNWERRPEDSRGPEPELTGNLSKLKDIYVGKAAGGEQTMTDVGLAAFHGEPIVPEKKFRFGLGGMFKDNGKIAPEILATQSKSGTQSQQMQIEMTPAEQKVLSPEEAAVRQDQRIQIENWRTQLDTELKKTKEEEHLNPVDLYKKRLDETVDFLKNELYIPNKEGSGYVRTTPEAAAEYWTSLGSVGQTGTPEDIAAFFANWLSETISRETPAPQAQVEPVKQPESAEPGAAPAVSLVTAGPAPAQEPVKPVLTPPPAAPATPKPPEEVQPPQEQPPPVTPTPVVGKKPLKIGDLFEMNGRDYELTGVGVDWVRAKDISGKVPVEREWQNIYWEDFEKNVGVKFDKSVLPEQEIKRIEGKEESVPQPPVQPTKEITIGPAEPKTDESLGLVSGTSALIQNIYRALQSGESFDNPKLSAMADKAFGGTKLEGKYTSRDAYDALEAAVNKSILEKGKKFLETDPKEALAAIRKSLAKLPRQTDRTKEQEEFQQFSTPPTQSFVVAKAADIKPDDVVLEPSAGTGDLAVWAKATGAKVYTNELSKRREGLLKYLGFDTTNVDAEILNDVLPENIKPTKVVMNPPFSATAGRVKANKTEYGARHIESALKRLQDGGRLVGIVGEGMALDRVTFGKWWKDIASKYNVRANIGIPGEEYGKYGTTFGNQLIIIDKNGPTPGANYGEQLNNIIKGKAASLEEALDLIKKVPYVKPESSVVGKPAASISVGAGKPGAKATGGATGGISTGGSGGGGGQVKAGGGAANVPPSQPKPKPVTVAATGGESKPGEIVAPGTGGPVQGGGGPAPDVAAARIETQKQTTQRQTEESGNFVQYKPSKLKGAKPHEGLVESASMAAVEPPDIKYSPKIPQELIEKGKISDAQLETICYAGQRHEQTLLDGRRAGYFIGDGTGVGKGREIAAIILDNWNRGRKKALWVSVSSDLKQDAFRDLKDVDAAHIPIELINDFSGKVDITMPEGIIFTTYSSFSRPERLKQVEAWLGKDGLVIFDESHKAKNFIGAGPGSQGTQTGAAVVGIQNDDAMKDLRVLYVSATGATDVRNMAYMTRLGLWGEGTAFPGGFGDFLGKIENGGVGAMEMVARDLKALGMYNSRVISYKGVEYGETKHPLNDKQIDMYDAVARLWQSILQNIDAAIDLTHAPARVRGRKMANFWAQNQRFFKQLLTAIKVPTVIKRTEEELGKGHSVVISLKGTGESRTKELVSKIIAEGGDLDDFDITPREIIGKMIEDSFPTELYQEQTDEHGNTISVPVLDANGDPVENKEAVAMRDELLDGLSKFDIPENPLDQIINYFGVDNVAELTGRTKRLLTDKKTGKKTYKARTSKGISQKEVNNSEREAFQSGKKRIAIISDAASTGISLHADKAAKNRQRRVQIALELGWSADKEIQTLGRTHRSGQEMPPIYDLLSTDVGGETRFSATLAKRLGSLGALTRGQRNVSGGEGLAKYNFETPQGQAALASLYKDMEHNEEFPGIKDSKTLLEKMGLVKKDEYGRISGIKDSDAQDVPRFLNRLLGLEVKEQNALFEEFAKRFDEVVTQEKQDGTFDEGVADLRGTSIRIRPNPTIVNTDETTGAITRHYVVEVDAKTTPFTFNEAAAKIPEIEKRVKADELEDNPSGFVKNEKSNRVYLLEPLARTTNARTGYTERPYRLTGPKNKSLKLDEYELSGYEPIKEPEAKELWAKEISKIPDVTTTEHHIIAGALIPVYDKLNDASGMKIVRVEATDGQRIVGVEVHDKDLAKVLQALGIKKSFKSAQEIFDNVLENGWDVDLVTGLTIHKTVVHSNDAIELKGVDPGQFDELRKMGLLNEKIDWKQRFFIPLDPDKGIPALEKLLKRYPAMSDDAEAAVALKEFKGKQKEASVKGVKEQAQPLNAKNWDVNLPAEKQVDETVNKTEIMDFIEKAFGAPVRGRATHRFKEAGIYYVHPEIIRLKKWGEIEVASHEVAHHIDKVLKKQLGMNWKLKSSNSTNNKIISQELGDLDYEPDRRKLTEGFAEFMRYYLTTDTAQEKAPKFYQYLMDEVFPKNLTLSKNIAQLKGKIGTWQKQGAEERIIQQIDWRGEHTKTKGLGKLALKIKENIIGNWINSLYPLEKIEKIMGLEVGKNIRPTQSPATMAVYSKSKAAAIVRTFVFEKAIDEFGNVIGPGLIEILKPIETTVGDAIRGKSREMQRFLAYAVAKRADNLHGRGIESGFDEADVKYILTQAYPKEKTKVYDEVADAVTSWSGHLIDWLVNAGGLSHSEAAIFRANNPVYLPFLRAFKEELTVFKHGSGGGGSVNTGKGIFAIKGSGRPTINPIESLIKQATGIIQKAQKIHVASLLADLAEKEGMGGFIIQVPPPMEATRFSLEDIKNVLRDQGVDILNIDLDKMATVFTQASQYKGKDNIVMIWRNGERKFYEVHPDVYRALLSMEAPQRGTVVKILAPFARAVRMGATGLRASFAMVKNPFRDILSFSILSRAKTANPFDVLINIPKMLIPNRGSFFWRYKNVGGNLAGIMGYDRATTMNIYDEMLVEKLGKAGKVLMVAKHPVNAVRDVMSFMEMAPRSVEIEKMWNIYRKKYPTWTDEDCFVKAFNDAQDVTVNFTRSGWMGRRLNEVNAFFNVAIQGPEKVYRAIKENPVRFFLKGLALITVPSILMWLHNKDKQWYKNLPNEYKYSNFFIETPDGNVIRLPIPFDVGILFYGVPMAMLDANPQAAKSLVNVIVGSLPNPFAINAIQPLVDMWRNKDYLGRPIEPRRFENLPSEYRAEPYTNETSKLLSHAANAVGIELSPIQIDYLMNTYTGGFMRQIPMHEIRELSDFPMLGDILVRTPDNPRRQLDQYFQDYAILKAKKEAKQMAPKDIGRLAQLDSFYKDWKEEYVKRLRRDTDKHNEEDLKKVYKMITKRLAYIGY